MTPDQVIAVVFGLTTLLIEVLALWTSTRIERYLGSCDASS